MSRHTLTFEGTLGCAIWLESRPPSFRRLERLREPGLQELSQLGGRLELRDRIQFFESRSESVRQTPDCPRPEFLVFRLEVQVMHSSGKVFRSFESALDEGLVDDHLGGHVRQFTSLPGFYLLSHRLKISLHSVNANRDAVDERERF